MFGWKHWNKKITKLTREEFYAFVINNHEYLKGIARAVSAEIVEQMELDINLVVRQEFKIPERESYKYDVNVKNEIELSAMRLSNAMCVMLLLGKESVVGDIELL